MKALDKLRAFAADLLLGFVSQEQHAEAINAIADAIEAEYQKAEDEWKAENGQAWINGYAECRAELMEGDKAIAADLEKAGWVRGPLDADGEMWHSGDMSDSNWGVIEGIAYADGRWLVSGHDISAPWIPADSIRHYNPPTVEDVLREMVAAYMDTPLDDSNDGEFFAEYAAKLRLAGDLGRGTCKDIGSAVFECSECGCKLDLDDVECEPTMWVDGVATVPLFCPNCGRKVEQ